MAGELSSCPAGETPPSRDAINGAAVVVSLLTVTALAIFAWALDSLISALVPVTEGVPESEP